MAFAAPGRDAPGAGATDSSLAEVRAALRAGELPKAIAAGEAAVAADPSSSEANDLLGRAYGLTAQDASLFQQMHLARRARACFARAVELDPRNVAALSDLARYDMRAPGVLGGGKKKARTLVDRVLELEPARGHVLSAELAELEKDPVRAEKEYREAIAADPRSAEGWTGLSAMLVSRRRFADARRLWREAAEETGAALPAWGLAGVALASGEELPAAAEALAAVLERPDWTGDPEPAQCHERLAAVYAELGRRREAAAELEAALRLEPGRADWRRRLGHLER